MSLSSFFSSFLPVVHADAPEEKEVKEEAAPQQEEEEAAQEEPQEEEEEAEEPEDEECAESAKCAPLTKHFLHCEEKVNAGEGFKGEDCIEEFCKCLEKSHAIICSRLNCLGCSSFKQTSKCSTVMTLCRAVLTGIVQHDALCQRMSTSLYLHRCTNTHPCSSSQGCVAPKLFSKLK
ncbi:hypothetical protein C8Q73DRAFT_273564 [Cubamyces lactineus]|nr:hypothetical protein C8Q73DRAFT_273564 [Cubamyces lactineus]